MYFWKVNALIDDLRHQRLGQKEQFKCLLFWGVITVVLTDPWLWKDHVYERSDTWFTVALLGIEVVGLYLCYCANGRSDGKDLFLRVYALTVPLLVRHLLWFAPLSIVGWILMAAMREWSGGWIPLTAIVHFLPVFTCLWTVFVVWRVSVCVGRAALPLEASKPMDATP